MDEAVDPLFAQAVALNRAGRGRDARSVIDRVLALRPDHAGALHLAGVIAFHAGDPATAARRFEAARAAAPDQILYHIDLGAALESLARDDLAARVYQTLVARFPGHAEGWRRRGRLYRRIGLNAVAGLAHAVRIEPNDPGSRSLLADAVAVRGVNRHQAEDRQGAAHLYRLAIALDPAQPLPYNNLGMLLQAAGASEPADQAFRRALRINPLLSEIYLNRGGLLRDRGRPAAALAFARAAAVLSPERAGCWNNLANAWRDQGSVDAAATLYQRAGRADPGYRHALSNLLLCLIALPGTTPQALAAAHRDWGRRFAPPAPRVGFGNNRDPERPLRIALLSPDFRNHSCAAFIEPLLCGRDPARLHITAFADVRAPDAVTARLRARADAWRDIAGVDDRGLIDLARGDAIDITVDLAGHTAGNRLAAFGRGLAPVQVSWLGYPTTTGVAAIGWRVTDAIADPSGDADRDHSETLLRLPGGFLAYAPPVAAPEPGARRDGGPLRLASFNALSKLNAPLLALWARVLAALPAATLLLKARGLDDPAARAHVAGLATAAGIPIARLELRGWLSARDDHLTAYNSVDIALDPGPYNGTTTTCEALWMGVPVVSLRGDRHAARVGASLLHRVGCADLIAETPDDYVGRVVALAADPDRRRHLRQALRPAMAASPLCDATRFGRDFADALRHAWRAWCRDPTGLPPGA
ncbi:MAG: tetratricopeptide repeat protein [Azospirillaceae bacterium]|nr:tetratricopeptide repeat protein [Azospirillaceae bacterium]